LSWPEPGPMLPLRAAPALISLVVLLASSRGAAQIEAPRPVEELAPDTPAPRLRTRREPPRPAPPPAEEEQGTPGVQAQEPARPPRGPVRAPTPPAAPVAHPAPASAPGSGRDRTPPPPLLVPTEGDEAILQAFNAWKGAERTRDPKASRTARERLAELRETLA